MGASRASSFSQGVERSNLTLLERAARLECFEVFLDEPALSVDVDHSLQRGGGADLFAREKDPLNRRLSSRRVSFPDSDDVHRQLGREKEAVSARSFGRAHVGRP